MNEGDNNMSNTYSLGRIGLNLRGDYDAAATYEHLDVVQYEGNSYAAKTACTGVLLTNTDSWMMLTAGFPSTVSSADDLYRLGIQAGLSDVLTVTSKKITEYAIVFPKPFLAGTMPVCIPVIYTGSTGLTMADVVLMAYASTNTQFTARFINNSSTTRTPRVSWIAIGIPDPAKLT